MSTFHDTDGGAECQCDSRHPSAGELRTAPFRVIADFREAIDGWQFTNVPDRMHSSCSWTAPVEYRYLETADYTVSGLSLFIVRHRADNFLAMLRHWPDSIAQQRVELTELQAAGTSCLIVIEGDAEAIAQVLKASDLVDRFDLSSPRSTGCDIPWLLAESQRAAEQMVFEIMHRAWQQAQAQVLTSLK